MWYVLAMRRVISHPGRLLKSELAARKLSANRLSLDIGVPLILWHKYRAGPASFPARLALSC